MSVRLNLAALRRDHFHVVAFFLTYFGVLTTYGLVTGSRQTIFYVIFLSLGAACVTFLYGGGRLSKLVLWGLALWGFLHMIGGLVAFDGRVVYEWSIGDTQMRLDKVVHFFGFGFATLAAYELLRSSLGSTADSASLAWTAGFVGLGIGAINETIEFLITLLPGESNVGGFTNTGWDLVANTLGVTTAALIAGKLERSGRLTPAPGRNAFRGRVDRRSGNDGDLARGGHMAEEGKCPNCGAAKVEGRLNCDKCGATYPDVEEREFERDPDEHGE